MKNGRLLAIIVSLIALVSVWWFFWARPATPMTFEECVAAGNPVMESYPRQCRVDGKTYTEYIGNELEKSDLIRVSSPRPNETISSPLTLTGEARGNWFFEASFPVVLVDWDGKIIAQGVAQTKSDWMTSDFVPFKATLTFKAGSSAHNNKGTLILRKDNPSGLPQNDDALEIPIVFAIPGMGMTPPPGPVACTMEAKLCPDGSAVGRVGPNCEFAACPAATSSTIVRAALGQTVAGLGVTLTPLAVISDSRCPVNVQCIWAGTVHAKVRILSGIGTSEMTFELGVPVTTEAEAITLKEVAPAPYAGVTIEPSSYRFTFEIKKR